MDLRPYSLAGSQAKLIADPVAPPDRGPQEVSSLMGYDYEKWGMGGWR
jgi:hypothetical protein